MFCISLFSGCAYYNYLYNAKQYYEEGEIERKEKSRTKTDSKSKKKLGKAKFEKCIASAGRMLEYYPDSRWEDDALLILAKAYYRIGQYRSAITKVNELTLKYPESQFVTEGLLWKGMSLLKVAQPDSAQRILSRLFDDNDNPLIKANAHHALANYYFEEDRYEQALERYRAVQQAEPDDEWLTGESWLKIGECLSLLERYEDAVALYDELLAKKAPRRLKFLGQLERGIVLMELDRFEEALTSFEVLLKDGAFIDLFPGVELQAGLCERNMGRYEESRKRLERLTETETRGVIAVKANYELGELLWEQWRDLSNASTALEASSKADRSSPTGKAADSLKSEMEQLYRFWQKIGFIESQMSAIDSVQRGLLELFPKDTVYVDSLKEKNRKSKKRKKKSSRRNRRDDDAIMRMVEEAQEEQRMEESESDSIAAEQPDTTASLDSTAIADLLEKRDWEQINELYRFASFHLFDRNDTDSAAIYFNSVAAINHPPFDSVASDDNRSHKDIWARSIASLAYVAKSDGDSVESDSLYGLILEELPDSRWSKAVNDNGNEQLISTKEDTLRFIYEEAENIWFEDADLKRARDIYLDIVNQADPESDVRAKSLLAAAYLSRRIVVEDTLTIQLYEQISEEFRGSEYAKLASDLKREISDRGEEQQEPEFDLMEHELNDYSEKFPKDFEVIDDPLLHGMSDKVYLPDDVDVMPEMATSRSMLKSYLSSHYPFEAFNDGVKGTVMLEFTVGIFGEIYDIKTMNVEPKNRGFEQSAEEVLRKLVYTPGRYRGREVPVTIKQRFAFRIPGMDDE